jgi:hypothetical protein
VWQAGKATSSASAASPFLRSSLFSGFGEIVLRSPLRVHLPCRPLPTLRVTRSLSKTEVTFHPHSPHCCFFTAVIRDGCAERGVSLARLSDSLQASAMGKIDDFTHPHFRLVAQLCRLLQRAAVLTSMRRGPDGQVPCPCKPTSFA